MSQRKLKIMFIPDTQIRPDNLEQNRPLLMALGQRIVDERPDVVVMIGDWWDFYSLNMYDMKTQNRLTFDGDAVNADVEAGIEAMHIMLTPLWELQARQRASKHKVYNPRRVFTMGNHEQRAERFPELKGFVDIAETLNELGWEVYRYLEPVFINGVAFCHYFYNPNSGRPYGGTAEFRLNKMKCSFVQGHEQTFKFATEYMNNGKAICGLVAGSCYLHEEGYKGYQGNNHFRGAFMLENVIDGMYDLKQFSTDTLLGVDNGQQ